MMVKTAVYLFPDYRVRRSGWLTEGAHKTSFFVCSLPSFQQRLLFLIRLIIVFGLSKWKNRALLLSNDMNDDDDDGGGDSSMG